MSLFITSLILGVMFFNYAPSFISAPVTFSLNKLLEENFNTTDGQLNWQLVHDNPDLTGKSNEAKIYIYELKNIKHKSPIIPGAHLWITQKNEEGVLKFETLFEQFNAKFFAQNLQYEQFDLQNGQQNWKLVNNNSNLKGNSFEAQQYIIELRRMEENNPNILGAHLWVIKKNKEQDYQQLVLQGFNEDTDNNMKIARRLWSASGGQYEAAGNVDVGSQFLSYLFTWIKNPTYSNIEIPVGITEWINQQYEGGSS